MSPSDPPTPEDRAADAPSSDPRRPGPPDRSGQDRGTAGGDDTLAIVALALGIAALTMSFIPFYGMGFAIPLGVVALVLGLLARRRRPVGRRMATAGAVTGGLALVVTVVVVIGMMFPFWGFRERATIEATATETVGVPADVEAVEQPDGPHDPAAPPPPVEVDPQPVEPPPRALEDATGEVELAIDGHEIFLELAVCTVGHNHGASFLRGEGPDGRILVQTGAARATADILLVVAPGDKAVRVLVGTQRGTTTSQRSTMIDRRRLEVVGTLRDALDNEPVEIRLVALCS
jgi:hypothetical protein